jgi:hypothetical protein
MDESDIVENTCDAGVSPIAFARQHFPHYPHYQRVGYFLMKTRLLAVREN